MTLRDPNADTYEGPCPILASADQLAEIIAEAAALPDYARPVSYIAYRVADVLRLTTTETRLAFFTACGIRKGE